MNLTIHRGYVVIVALFGVLVHAQPWTNATCTNPETTWTVNSLRQSPCLVAATLSAVCEDDNTWGVPALDGNFTSYGAGKSSKCLCNSVVWSLLSACSLCQGKSSSAWTSYSEDCLIEDISLAGVYPATIPLGVAVPNWAYYNYVTADMFNVEIARQQTGPESTAPPRPSSTTAPTSTSTISTGSLPTTTTITTPAPVNNPPSKSDTSAIVGGVVGGVLGIALFALIAFIVVHKGKQKQQQHEAPTQFDGTHASYGQYQSGQQSSSLAPTTPSYKPYDPSSPSGFSTGHPNSPNIPDSVPNLYYQQNAETRPPRPNVPQL